MMVRKFKGYVCRRQPVLVTDSQYFKRVMEMTPEKQQMLPTNMLRWITEIKTEVCPKEVILIKSEDNPADLLTRFTTQGTANIDDTLFLQARFNIDGTYEPGHLEDTTKGPDNPGTLKLHTGKSPMVKLMAAELTGGSTHKNPAHRGDQTPVAAN